MLAEWMGSKGRFPFIGGPRGVIKPLIMVDDLVAAQLAALDKGRAGEIYLLHSDGDHTLDAIVETAGRLAGARRTHVSVPVIIARFAAYGFAAVHRLAPRWNPPLTPERIRW